MIVTLGITLAALRAIENGSGDLEISYVAPLIIDLVALYITGAYLGVFPTI